MIIYKKKTLLKTLLNFIKKIVIVSITIYFLILSNF